MADTTQFTIGTEASCSDGAVGKVSRVIIDPLTDKVTHLVVEAEHRRDSGRLVPLDLIDEMAGQVRYEGFGYGPGQVGYWPYYRLGGGMGMRASSSTRAVVT
jgi:hypothetical protein